MSLTRFDEADIKKKVPKKVLARVRENMESHNMSLSDAFREAAREKATLGTRLFTAWYYDDFREFIPIAYEEKYLDFSKYPLKYDNEEEQKAWQI